MNFSNIKTNRTKLSAGDVLDALLGFRSLEIDRFIRKFVKRRVVLSAVEISLITTISDYTMKYVNKKKSNMKRLK